MEEQIARRALAEVSQSREKLQDPPLSDVLDVQVLLQQMDGNWELLSEVAKVFLGDCPSLLGSVRMALDTLNAQALERAAHRLKGTVSQFAAPRATEVARTLEHMGQDG